MALKSATTTLATIQMRRGAEENFDPDQMTAGEWAVSTDSKKVWMCFRPGFVLRMATYEAFEEDMKIIQQILKECQDVKVAVEAFVKLAERHSKESQSWSVGGTGTREGEDADNSKYYSEQSKKWSDAAENALDVSRPDFTVNLETGHLLYSGGRFDFEVENGHLLWGIVL